MVLVQKGNRLADTSAPSRKTVDWRTRLTRRDVMIGVGIFALFVVLVISARYFVLPSLVSFVRGRFTPALPTPTPPTAVVIEQSGDGGLNTPSLDHAKLNRVIQDAWDRALTEGATNVVSFTNDPDLVAFGYRPAGSDKETAIVVYRNRPITLRTRLVESLPDDNLSRVTLRGESYHLVVEFEYTSRVKTLDIEKTLNEAFAQAIMGK